MEMYRVQIQSYTENYILSCIEYRFRGTQRTVYGDVQNIYLELY